MVAVILVALPVFIDSFLDDTVETMLSARTPTGRMIQLFILCLGLLISSVTAAQQPIADIHLHYKWNQTEVTSPDQAIGILRENNIGMAVVMGTPPELALKLENAAPDLIVPLYGIYPVSGYWSQWHNDPDLLERTRKALKTGLYQGIGEVHMIGGFIPSWEAPNIKGLFELAAEFDLPAMIHVEFSTADYLLGLCRAHPDTRLLLSHAGAPMPVTEVERAMDACGNLWMELSARDPWRYIRHPITDEQGVLTEPWSDLVLKYSDRIMVGSDPVWPVEQLDAWDEDDTGWLELYRFIGFHRHWLAQLPADVARDISWNNAKRFFAPNSD